ncbi:MAG: TolC family protein [Flammeovirgaceae bacterium]|nr:TolC family protein [Flammeovirgaceae bacterium]
MLKKTFFFFLILSFPICLNAQQNIYTLEDVVALAQGKSLWSLRVQNQKEQVYWAYKSFQAEYKPQLGLDGVLPDFNRSIDPITQDDGTEQFRRRTFTSAELGLGITQRIAPTGGTVFMGSEIGRIQQFGDNEYLTYRANPITVGIFQPIFTFNQYKWDRKIEPILYEEAMKEYNEDIEGISLRASGLFFDLLLAQISLEIAKKNRANNDTIYKIGLGRYELGKIAENELLQLELNLRNSEQQVSQEGLNVETSTLELNQFIGSNDNTSIFLIEPTVIPEFKIDENKAIEQAKQNRQQYLSFKRQQLEAERNVAEAKGESGLNVQINGSFGLTSTSESLDLLYQDPQDRENLSVTFQIPIIDWGRQKSAIKSAIANQELIKNTVAQEEINFEQEIYVLVKRFQILKSQLAAAIIADEIGQKRYDIAQQRYLVAKISITDLNIALQDKDTAKRSYLNALRDFWQAYYEIRMLTLYDFERNEVISYE